MFFRYLVGTIRVRFSGGNGGIIQMIHTEVTMGILVVVFFLFVGLVYLGFKCSKERKGRENAERSNVNLLKKLGEAEAVAKFNCDLASELQLESKKAREDQANLLESFLTILSENSQLKSELVRADELKNQEQPYWIFLLKSVRGAWD